MQVQKVIKCKIVGLTNIKRKQLQTEYDNLQIYLQTLDDWGVYSANKQQAERFYKRIVWGREYPISIRKDLIDIRETTNKLSKYWIKIPIKGRKGGLKVAIKPHTPIFKEYELCESKLFPKKNNWWLYITVQKEIKIKKSYSNILAIDLVSGGLHRWCNSLIEEQSSMAKN